MGWPQGARHPEALGAASFLRSGRAHQRGRRCCGESAQPGWRQLPWRHRRLRDRAGSGDRFQGKRPRSARPVGRSRMNEVISAPEALSRVASVGKDPVLRVVNGSKIYGGVHAIENIDFDLYAGEVHGLVGENGAGKSTLCKAIAGAIKLTSGDYYVDGKPVNFERPLD